MDENIPAACDPANCWGRISICAGCAERRRLVEAGQRTCCAAGCDRRIKSAGFCKPCYAEWLAVRSVRVACCTPDCGGILYGRGMCRPCYRRWHNSNVRGIPTLSEHHARQKRGGEREFHELAEACGITEISGVYIGSDAPVECICARGHAWSPTLGSLRRGKGCRVCANKSPASAEAQFREAARRLRLTVVGNYVTTKSKVDVICPQGHRRQVHPGRLPRQTIGCTICAKQDKATARQAFEAAAEEAGVVLTSEYVSSGRPVRGTCPDGHELAVRPNNIQSGGGFCRQCACAYDRIYLIAHPTLDFVKVGIAARPGRVRLHESRGWKCILEVTGLEHREAQVMERAVLKTVRDYGFPALRREECPHVSGDGFSETFHRDALHIALDVMEASGLTIPDHLRGMEAA